MSGYPCRLQPVRTILALSAFLVAGAALAADQWFDPGASAGFTGGTAAWDLVTPAWANTSAGTNSPVTFGTGNNAWFVGPAGTATVDGATAGWLVLNNASGAGNTRYFNPGAGALALTNGITTYASALLPHSGQGVGGVGWIGADLTLGADVDVHVANYTLTVTGRLTGAYTLGKCGYSTLILSNTANNAFGAFALRNGAVYAYGGGTVLGGGPVTLGAALPAGETLANFIQPNLLVYNQGGAPQTVTTIGDLYVDRGASLGYGYAGPGTNRLVAGNLVRTNGGTLAFAGNHNVYKLNITNQFAVSGLELTNGILPLWIVDTFNAGPDYLTTNSTGVAVFAYETYNPAFSNRVVNLPTATNLSADMSVYALKIYALNLNLNGRNLTVGDGVYAGLNTAGRIVDTAGGGALRFGAAELLWAPAGAGGLTGVIGVPMEGTGPLTVFGKSITAALSNTTLYAGGPITVQPPVTLQLWPLADVTLSNSLYASPKGAYQKMGTNTLTLHGSTGELALASTLSVNGGTLVLDDAVLTNSGTLSVSGNGVSLVLTNNARMPGLFALSMGGSNARLAVTDGVLGTGTNTLYSWSVNGTSNRMEVRRSQLASQALTIGAACSNNTLTIDGPGTLWNFGGGNFIIGGQPATGNVVLVNGGGTADGAILTNIAQFSVGQGGNSLEMSGMRCEIANGASVYVSIGPLVGQGNNGSVTSNNVLRIGGGPAACFLRSAGTISVGGGGNSNAFCGGNTIDITNAVIFTTGSSMGGPNNSMTVRAGAWWDMAGGAYSLGGSGVSNTMTINGGIVTNVGRTLFSSMTGTLAVINGGRLIGTGSGNGNQFFDGMHAGSLAVSNGALLVYVRAIDFATSGGRDNRFLIDNAVVTNAVGSYLTIGGVANVNLSSRNNSLVITNGGRLFGGGTLTLGNSGNYANSGAYGNTVLVTGSGSLLDNGGQAITIGNSFVASNNSLQVLNGARVMRAGTVSIGVNATNNSALVLAGGLLESSALTVGAAVPGLGNTLACTNGVLQFTTAAPTITRGTAGSLTLTDGVLAFRGVANANVKGNWSTTLTNITYAGTNAFRLDNATNNTASPSQSYWFDTNRGTTNFAGLELFNGGTAYTNGSVTVGTNGWLTFSNTQATMWGPVTNYGVMSVFDSTVTFKSNLVLAEGSTLVWSTNNTTNAVTVLGSLSLPAALTVYAPVAIPKGDTLTLFNAPGGLTGSTAGWSVIPDSYRVNKAGNTVTLTRKAAGSIILVR